MANKSEKYLQSLLHEITSAVEEAKATKTANTRSGKKRVGKRTKLPDGDSVVGQSDSDFFQNRRNLKNRQEFDQEPDLQDWPDNYPEDWIYRYSKDDPM